MHKVTHAQTRLRFLPFPFEGALEVLANGFNAVWERGVDDPELDPRFESKGCDLLNGMLRTSPTTV